MEQENEIRPIAKKRGVGSWILAGAVLIALIVLAAT